MTIILGLKMYLLINLIVLLIMVMITIVICGRDYVKRITAMINEFDNVELLVGILLLLTTYVPYIIFEIYKHFKKKLK